MKKLNTRWQTSPICRRLPWTFLILFVYLLGRTLPVPTVSLMSNYLKDENANRLLENLATVSGGTFSSITLFSLGLSPYMTGMILWRFLMFFDTFKKMPSKQIHKSKMILILIVALIQSFGLTRTASFVTMTTFGQNHQLVFRLITMLIMIVGAFVLMWLGEMNNQKGIGSTMIIIISNMILGFLTSLYTFLTSNTFTLLELVRSVCLFGIGIAILVGIAVITYRAEYRIRIRRINIVSSFSEETYLPIKLIPAGGMPFMYGMTLMILPPLIVSGLLSIFPNDETLKYLSSNVGLTQLPGVLFYIALLAILSIGFSYYNYDPSDMAENMQLHGDYIEYVRPGKDTADYINHYLKYLIAIGTIFVMVMGGGPMLVRWSQGGEVTLVLLITNVYIVTILMMSIVEQIETLQSWKRYQKLF